MSTITENESSSSPTFFQSFTARFAILQTILISLLVSLWFYGFLQRPFEAENAFICYVIAAMGVLGLVCVYLKRWLDVAWLARHMIRVGLLGTVIGLIVAFSIAGSSDVSDTDQIKQTLEGVISGMYVALYATLMGVAVNLWLKVNMKVLGKVD